MIEATQLPAEVNVTEIAEEALQAAFGMICNRLEDAGYPVTGDVSPGEVVELDRLFASFVRAIALNNDSIGAMQSEQCQCVYPDKCFCPESAKAIITEAPICPHYTNDELEFMGGDCPFCEEKS